MGYSTSILLLRNLHDVFGENDSARRREAVDEIYTEDIVFYDPNNGVYRGRDEIDRVAGAIRATHPESRYQNLTQTRVDSSSSYITFASRLAGDRNADNGAAGRSTLSNDFASM